MEGVGGVWKDTMKQPKIETEMLRLTVNPPPPLPPHVPIQNVGE